MPETVNPLYNELRAFTPYITVGNAAAAMEFYKNAFGAEESFRLEHAGKVGHAEMTIAGAPIMLSDEFPEGGVLSPESCGGSPVCMHLYVEDVDAFVARAVASGAKIVRPVADQFYGDRGGKLSDPFGHLWWFATHKEDVSPEEMKRRADALYGGGHPSD